MPSPKAFFDPKTNHRVDYLFIDEAGEFWAIKKFGKQLKKKKLKTNNLQKAKFELIKALAKWGDPEATEKAPTKLVKDYWQDLIEVKTNLEGARPSTLRRMDTIWRNHLEPYWANLRVADIKPDMMLDFVKWHKEKRPGVQLVNVYKYLGNILRYMVEINVLPSTQMPKLRLPKPEADHHGTKKGRYIKPQEFEAILRKTGEREHLILGLAYHLGMRLMEIGGMRLTQVRIENDRIFIDLSHLDSKTGIPRVVPVPQFLRDEFLKWMMKNGHSKFIFPTVDRKSHVPSQIIDRAWQKAKKDAKIEGKMRFHDLRHTCATNFAKRNANPVLAVTLLGMSLITYQKTYLNLGELDLITLVENTQKTAIKLPESYPVGSDSHASI